MMQQQQALQSQNYRYQPKDVVVRAHYQQQGVQGKGKAAAHDPNRGEGQDRDTDRDKSNDRRQERIR